MICVYESEYANSFSRFVYTDAQTGWDFKGMAECLLFQNSFRLDVMIMLEVLQK